MHLVCPHCQNPVELSTLPPSGEVLCPSCGSGFHLVSGSTAAEQPRDDRLLGKFRLLGPLGSGAFGTVYKAHDTELDRSVAIKVPRPGTLDRAQDRDRFLREARSAAQLRHPSIVSIHEVGQHDGVPFLVSDLVHGVTLAEWLTAHRPTTTQAAQWTATLADALQHAHAQGVVHRDVKPSNIMVGEQGTLHLMDFGLARRDAGEVTVTLEGQVLGTPAYMSPEQARGEAHVVDGRSDVYSLGVVLYQLLTGELPFRGSTRMLLHQVLHDEPRNPRSLNDRIPRDLETICLKAMAKEPGRRYQAASDMAEDLRRFLAGQSIHARPVGRLERAGRWCRRNPVVAGLAAGVVLSLLGGSGAAGYFAVHMARQAYLATQRAEELTQEKQRTEQEERANRRHAYATQMGLVADAWERGDLRAVQQLLESVVPRRGQEDLRGQEWHYFWQQCHGFRCSIPGRTVAFLDAGRSLAVGGAEGVALHDVANGQLRRRLAQVTSDVHPVVVPLADGAAGIVTWTRSEGLVVDRIDASASRRLLRVSATELPVTGRSPVRDCVGEADRLVVIRRLNSDGKQEAASVWSLLTGTEERRLTHIPPVVDSLAMSLDGKTCVLAGAVRTATQNQYEASHLQVRDAVTGQLRRTLLGPAAFPNAVKLSADGTTLAAGFGRWDPQAGKWLAEPIRLWDLTTMQQTATLATDWPVSVLAMSADGNLLAAGHLERAPVRVWQLSHKEKWVDLWGAPATVDELALSPDGKLLAAGSSDNVVRVWGLDTPPSLTRPGAALPATREEVRCLAFSPDGRVFASAGLDHTVRLWDGVSGDERGVLHGHQGPVHAVSFSADGQWLAGGGEDARVLLWHVEQRRLAATLTLRGPVRALAFAPAEALLAVGTPDDGVALHAVTANGVRPLRQFSAGRVRGLAFGPDGKVLATAGGDNSVRLWDVATGAARPDFRGTHANVSSVAFSRDGRILASGGRGDGALRLWDLTAGKPLLLDNLRGQQTHLAIHAGGVAFAGNPELLVLGLDYAGSGVAHGANLGLSGRQAWGSAIHPVPVQAVAASPDGSTVAVGFRDGTLLLLDGKTGKERRFLAGHGATATALAFSPDGSFLAEARADFTIRLRDRQTGEQRHCLRGHAGRVTALTFSADGRRLASASQDRTLKVWTTLSGELHATLETDARAALTAVALSPDGNRVAAAEGLLDSSENRVWVWKLTSQDKPLILEPHGWTIRGLSFSADGSKLAVATASIWNNLHGNLTVWETATGKQLAATGNSHTREEEINRSTRDPTWLVTALAFSPDGKRLATASHDLLIRLWDLDTLTTAQVLRGHTARIVGLALAADGRMLASAARDGTVRFWDLPEQRERFHLGTPTPDLLALSPDGQSLATADLESGLVRLWSPPSPAMLADYAAAATGAGRSSLAAAQAQLGRLHLRLAELHASQLEAANALAFLRSAAEPLQHASDPVDPRSLLVHAAARIGETLSAHKQANAASDAFQEAARLQPGSAEAQQRLAQEALRAGRHDQAVAAAREAVRLDPTGAGRHYTLGMTLWHAGQHTAAHAAFAEALRLDRTLGDQLIRDASAPGYEGKHDEAVALLREAVALQPESGLAVYRLGYFLGKRGDIAGQREKYTEAVRLAPDDLTFRENLIAHYIDHRATAEALTACRELVRQFPTRVEGYGLLGLALEQQGARREALAAYQEAIRLNPALAWAHKNLGNVLADLGWDEEAIAAYREALQLQPHNASWHHRLGVLLNRRQRPGEAIATLREAVRLMPHVAQLHFSLGGYLINRGRNTEAIIACREAARLDPALAKVHYWLGVALLNDGQHADAVTAFREAVRRDPADALSFSRLGIALFETGQRDEALAAAEEALRLKPNDAILRNNRGVLYERRGDLDRALADFREVVQLRPEYYLGYHNVGDVLVRQQQLAAAVVAYREALRREPKSAATHNSLGQTLERQGRLDEAERAYREALRVDLGFTQARANLVRMLREHGRVEEVVALLKDILRLRPEWNEVREELRLLPERRGMR